MIRITPSYGEGEDLVNLNYRLAICSVFHGTVPYFDPLFRAFSALFRIFRGDQELSNGVSNFFLRHLGAEIIEVEYFDHLTMKIYENQPHCPIVFVY